MKVGLLAVLSGRNARGDSEMFESSAERVAIVAAVGDEDVGRRQGVDQQAGALVIAHRPFGEQHHK